MADRELRSPDGHNFNVYEAVPSGNVKGAIVIIQSRLPTAAAASATTARSRRVKQAAA